MAQFVQPVVKYSGTFTAIKGELYLGSSFTLGNVMEIKTNSSVSIGGTDAFSVSIGDTLYIHPDKTYLFTSDCLLLFGEVMEII